jgi:hypothetical protein
VNIAKVVAQFQGKSGKISDFELQVVAWQGVGATKNLGNFFGNGWGARVGTRDSDEPFLICPTILPSQGKSGNLEVWDCAENNQKALTPLPLPKERRVQEGHSSCATPT